MNNTINISEISENLQQKDGIWICKNRSSYSYPESGNELCFSIEENSFWFKHRVRCIIEAIRKFPPPSNIIFDVGGGNGFVSQLLISNGFTTYLVEPGEKGIQNARNRGLNNLIWSTIDDAGFKRESIPSVGLFDVLEHIEDDEGFLKSIRNCLQRNGYLYITVPSYNFLWSKDDAYAGHYRRYTIKKLEAKLSRAGFVVKYSTYFFSFLPVPIFLFRKIPGMLRKQANINLQTYASIHTSDALSSNFIMNKLLKHELKRISKLHNISFGSSCLIVATDND